MKKYFLTLLFLTSVACFSQDTLIINTNDSISTQILQELSEKTKSYQNIKADFKFTFENTSQDILEEQDGSISIQENSFKLEINQQIIISDGSTQWIYLKESNEVQIMEYDVEDDMMSPSKLFTIYEKGYKNSYIELKSLNGKNMHIIDLFSIESNAFKKIQLQIDADKNQLDNIILYDKNGGSFTYLITNFKTNFENTGDNTYKFIAEDYTDVQIIDLR